MTTAEAQQVDDADDSDSDAATPAEVVHTVRVRPLTVAVSFEDVYRSSFARMIRVAFLLTGSNHTAEEIVQDAFVALYQRFEAVVEPAAYLYTSVVNGCRARHRRQAVADRLHPLRPATEVLPPDLDETWDALKQITPRRRSAIVLRFYADLSLADTAEVLGCSEGTVKSLIHRGLAQLKDVIEP